MAKKSDPFTAAIIRGGQLVATFRRGWNDPALGKFTGALAIARWHEMADPSDYKGIVADAYGSAKRMAALVALQFVDLVVFGFFNGA